ncbi:MAG: ACP S-malonyltransferase [bacterium]|nr:ACP S-malonyltransferase [bacterium]
MTKIAFLFSGQGTQYVGMGLDNYKSSGLAQMLFKQANDILGFDLAEIMFNGPDEKLRQTEITQVAIFLDSYCRYLLLNKKPDMTAGHSLGMYAALAAAEAFEFEEALRLVDARAKAMQYAGTVNQGTMAAILGLTDSDVERICREASGKAGYAQVANYNCPGQAVISGTVEAVAEAMKQAKREGAVKVIQLKVSGAFHSLLMEPAYDKFAPILDQSLIHKCRFPVYSDLDGQMLNSADAIHKSLLQQLIMPVRWPQVIRQMAADGAEEFIEVGPGEVLKGMIKRILSDRRKTNAV